MKNTFKIALLGAAFGASITVGSAADAPDCFKVSETVKAAVQVETAKVLEIVEARVAANEKCACEIVRAAILGSEADKNLVASIVGVAANAAPSEARLISQCALAVAPDAAAEIQAVMASFDKAQGDSAVVSYEKGGFEKGGLTKGGVEPASAVNDPLDFPAGPEGSVTDGNIPGGEDSVVGPPPGAPGGPTAVFPPGFPPLGQPPVVANPALTPQ